MDKFIQKKETRPFKELLEEIVLNDLETFLFCILNLLV